MHILPLFETDFHASKRILSISVIDFITRRLISALFLIYVKILIQTNLIYSQVEVVVDARHRA